jgi:hypothetical protein
MARAAIPVDPSASSTTSLHFPMASGTTPFRFPIACQATVTNRGLAALLLSIHRGYCEAMFDALAARSPDELVDLVRECRAPNTRLTYAAEILGRHVATRRAVDTLLHLLRDHPSPLVREGAVAGLGYHLEEQGVQEALRFAASKDPSPGLRSAVVEILEG